MIWLLFTPLVAFIALAIAAHFGLLGLSLEKTIKLSDTPNVIAVTLVAFIIQHVMQKRSKATDAEKDLLTGQVSEVLSYLVDAKHTVAQAVGKTLTPMETAVIVQAFEECGESLSSLQFCIERSHCKNLAVRCKAIGETFLSYKQAITGANFPVTPISQADYAASSVQRGELDRNLKLLSMQVGKE